MKISKSKQELARIISENGGWLCADFAAQQDDGEVWFSSTKPEWNVGRGLFSMGYADHFTIGRLIANRHQTTLSRTEYSHLYPAPDADGWIEWLRDEPPVGEGVIIDVKYSDGDELHSAPCGVFTANMTSIRGECASAESFGRGDGSFVHIIAYRLHKQAGPEFCESVTRAIPEPDEQVWTNPPTIEQLAADYRNANDYAERKQQEADDAKADADARLKSLELAGEAIGLIVSPITAKQESELVITDWRDLRVGDVIELTGSVNPCWKEHSGREMTVKNVYPEQGYYDDQADLLGESGSWSLGGNTTWRFIRRP